MTNTTPSGVTTTRTSGKISLDKLAKSDFQKPGTTTAQIRQEVLTVSSYPSKKTSSDKQANIFSNDDFGFESQVFESVEVRIAWLLVPENVAEDIVKQKIEAANANGACIYRVLSNAPILDENQKYAISAGLRTLDMFAKTQASRYPSNQKTIEDGTAGKLILDREGRVQYRRTFFWNTPIADQDLRGKEVYVSAELQAELSGASVMSGQSL